MILIASNIFKIKSPKIHICTPYNVASNFFKSTILKLVYHKFDKNK
jgi:hypothetical protein